MDYLAALVVIGGLIGFIVGWIVIGVKWFSDRRKKRRDERGECIYCGYDMRSNPDICSECGRKSELKEIRDMIDRMKP